MADLKIARKFNVVPKVVFDAFTKAEAMRVWWTKDTEFNMDVRVGGTWTITRKENGTIFTMTGKYVEVNNPRRLKYTLAMPQFSPNSDIVTIDIIPERKDKCHVIFVQSGTDINTELLNLHAGQISGSEKGWQKGFDLMETAWKQ